MRILIAICILLFSTTLSNAAFPIQQKANTVEAGRRQTDVDFKKLVNNSIEKFTHKPPSAPAEERTKGAGIGIGAFAAGIIGLAALIVGFAIASPVLVGVAIVAGIGAIVLGAMGLRRAKGGFALAGMVLGIVNLSALLIIALIALLALNFFEL